VEKPSTNKQTNKLITFNEPGNEWVRVNLKWNQQTHDDAVTEHQ